VLAGPLLGHRSARKEQVRACNVFDTRQDSHVPSGLRRVLQAGLSSVCYIASARLT
jgi:hypothetical protein